MLEFGGDPISVAIRVRPSLSQIQSSKEKENSLLQVEDSTTISITNPEDLSEIRVFGFTHCYWSADGFAELPDGLLLPDLKHRNGPKYSDQKKVYDHFGKEMVQNAYLGFNSSLICMGESGSGKSWTLFGNGANKGVISLFGAELYKTIKDKEKATSGSSPVGNIVPEIKITMMEIQENNKVKDLLLGNNTKYKSVVKVREHPKRGFYVEGLRSIIISNADDISRCVDDGHTARAINSTSFNLNCTKSTIIVGLSLVQKYRNAKGDEVAISALVDFYDLPVSHGPQNKSGLNLSQKLNGRKNEGPSLSSTFDDDHFTTLVSSLKNNSSIAYANSTVTKLLERALSGNSKTYVISHCNPTEISYETSLSTLILADTLQRLTTHSILNEEMTHKLTRELKLENDNLKKMLTNGDSEKNEFFAWSDKLDWLQRQDSEEFRRQLIDDIKSQVKDNEREIKMLNQSLDEKIKLAELDKPNDINSQTSKKFELERKHKPFILNLNQDAQLSSRILHLILPGSTDFGSGKGKDGTIIQLIGPGIREIHGSFTHILKENKMSIKPANSDCLIKVNGKPVLFESPLFHNDRIVFGGSQIWLFQNPREPWADKIPSKITFQFAQEELASKSSFFINLSQNGQVSTPLKTSVFKVFPLIDDVNAMCDDLEKAVRFDLIVIHDIYQLLSIQCFDDSSSFKKSEEVAVQLTLLKEEMSFILPLPLFEEKYKHIKNLFIQVQEDGIVGAAIGNMNSNSGGDANLVDVANTEVTIGYGLLSLKPLAYLIQFQEDVVILDYLTLKPIGSIKIEIVPCNAYFEPYPDVQSFLTNSSELLAKPLYFTLKMGSSESLSMKFKDITCKYKLHTEPITSTGKLDSKSSSYNTTSNFQYERRFSIEHVSSKLIESLEKDLIIFTFFGRQRPKKMRNQFFKKSSESEYNNYQNPEDLTNSPYLGLIQKEKAELIVSKTAGVRVEQKLGILQTMLELCTNLDQDSIPVDYIKKIFNAKDKEMALQSVADFKEEFTPPLEIDPVKKLTTYQKVSEVCTIV